MQNTCLLFSERWRWEIARLEEAKLSEAQGSLSFALNFGYMIRFGICFIQFRVASLFRGIDMA